MTAQNDLVDLQDIEMETFARLYDAYFPWHNSAQILHDVRTLICKFFEDSSKPAKRSLTKDEFTQYWQNVSAYINCRKKLKSAAKKRIGTIPIVQGLLTASESMMLLRNKPAGAFLVRFSPTAIGSVSFSYVKPDKTISHTRAAITDSGLIEYELVQDDGSAKREVEDLIVFIHRNDLFSFLTDGDTMVEKSKLWN